MHVGPDTVLYSVSFPAHTKMNFRIYPASVAEERCETGVFVALVLLASMGWGKGFYYLQIF